MSKRKSGVRKVGPTRDATISGERKSRRKKENYTFTSQRLSGDDSEAYWEDAEITGEETAGGDSSTPDQDQVDPYGQALGIRYGQTEAVDITRRKSLDSNSANWEQVELKEAKEETRKNSGK
ncbi:MAG: DUF6335 family protein [Patescibacteria group bacterium]|nr:DUF6335 family protein [Patescibacteria group bacterium]